MDTTQDMLSSHDIFPILTSADIRACQFSSWYRTFSKITMKATIISPLPDEFKEFMESDGIVLPEGSENIDTEEGAPASETGNDQLEDEGEIDSDSEAPPLKTFAFPELDAQIRKAMVEHGGAVFPKLNWTSPQDAAWILNPSSPLKCTSPSDVYLYLKSSDFVMHDLDPEMVFDGCIDIDVPISEPVYSLELVLKKWYPVERSREMRCFVRDDIFIGICERDLNYYEFLNQPDNQETIRVGLREFWETKINGRFSGGKSYVFDVILTRSLSSAHLVDINPYAPRTDSLLFTYPELQAIFTSQAGRQTLPFLRVITSSTHPAASRNAPANQHNMVPREALELSQGRSMAEFRESWVEHLSASMDN